MAGTIVSNTTQALGSFFGLTQSEPFKFSGKIGHLDIDFTTKYTGAGLTQYSEELKNLLAKYFGANITTNSGVGQKTNPLLTGIQGGANGAANGAMTGGAPGAIIGGAAGAIGGIFGSIVGNSGITDAKQKDSLVANALGRFYEELKGLVSRSNQFSTNMNEAKSMQMLTARVLSQVEGLAFPSLDKSVQGLFVRPESYKERFEPGGKYYAYFGANTNAIPGTFNTLFAGLETFIQGRSQGRPQNRTTTQSQESTLRLASLTLPPRGVVNIDNLTRDQDTNA